MSTATRRMLGLIVVLTLGVSGRVSADLKGDAYERFYDQYLTTPLGHIGGNGVAGGITIDRVGFIGRIVIRVAMRDSGLPIAAAVAAHVRASIRRL